VEAAADLIDRFVGSLPTEVRSTGSGSWALMLDAAGYAVEVEVAIRGPLLRAQAAVLPPGLVDPHQLLVWNRQAPLVCFALGEEGEVMLCGEVPLASLDVDMLDRFLGLLLASATRARNFVIRGR
jgi:hypothetical protein